MRNFYSLMYIVLSILPIGLAIPLILKKIPPNEIYGFRTARSLSDEKVWYAANYFSGWTLLIAGIISLIAIIILHFYPQLIQDTRHYGIIVTGIFAVPLLLAVLVSYIYSLRL